MRKVAILDDELIFRNQVSSLLTDFPQLTVAIATGDPYELLDFLENQQVDLIFLDMNMPKMSGIEFLARAETQQRRIKVIVMSGFSDFQYAQESIRYGVSEYILKHQLDSDVLRLALQKIGMFESSAQPAITSFDFGTLLSLPDHQKEAYMQQFAESFRVKQMIAMTIVPISIGTKIGDKRKYKLRAANVLEDLVQDMLASDIQEVSQVTAEGDLNILFSFVTMHSMHDIEGYLNSLEYRLRNVSKRLLDVAVFIRVSGLHNDLVQALAFFENPEKLSNELFFSKNGESIHGEGLAEFAKEYELAKMHLLLRKIYFFTCYYNKEEVVRLVKEVFGEVRRLRLDREVGIRLISQMEFMIGMAMSDTMKMPIDTDIQVDYYQHYDTINRIETNFLATLEESLSRYYQVTIGQLEEGVQQALLYIHQHFREEISLQDCAEAISLNYAYLSRIFKKSAPASFSKYLSTLRIEMAKILLADHQYSVNEVANLCGYSSYNYFFRIFKEVTQTSPNAFISRDVCSHFR